MKQKHMALLFLSNLTFSNATLLLNKNVSLAISKKGTWKKLPLVYSSSSHSNPKGDVPL